ncbi:MAG: hypothetical protein Q8P18_18330 [Pseudomonadota bacterium]|nr:hypothetical protein [Pseudomonadota bacterium]
MANELLYSGVGSARLSEILHSELHVILADYTDLSALVPVVREMNGAGSTTLKTARVDWDNAMAAVAENASTSNTALSFDSVTGSFARQALQRQASDLYEITGSMPDASIPAIAQSMALAAMLRKTDMICTLFSSVSGTVGTTTVDLTVSDMYSAMFALMNTSVPLPYIAALYPVQFTDFMSSLQGEVGPQAFAPATQAMLAAKGPGYKGNWQGIEFFTSDSIPTANGGADSNGCLFSPNAFAAIRARQNVVVGGQVVFPDAEVAVEFERDAGGALTKIVGNLWYGCYEQEDALAVGIVTDR